MHSRSEITYIHELRDATQSIFVRLNIFPEVRNQIRSSIQATRLDDATSHETEAPVEAVDGMDHFIRLPSLTPLEVSHLSRDS
jgi:hypothetical protein